jgi:hypothetical protein
MSTPENAHRVVEFQAVAAEEVDDAGGPELSDRPGECAIVEPIRLGEQCRRLRALKEYRRERGPPRRRGFAA